jgi:hypothetical protein
MEDRALGPRSYQPWRNSSFEKLSRGLRNQGSGSEHRSNGPNWRKDEASLEEAQLKSSGKE